MRITFGDEHEAFREEVRTFLDTALPDDLRAAEQNRPGFFLDYEYNNRWHRILYEKGWVAPSWPKEYGGTGWDLARRYIWSLESSLAQAPSLFPTGLGMCGPMLIGHGTAEQKEAYLPRILSGEDYWCQGYSEPGSGSDLASLKLKAESDGDDYLLTGTKIWTSTPTSPTACSAWFAPATPASPRKASPSCCWTWTRPESPWNRSSSLLAHTR